MTTDILEQPLSTIYQTPQRPQDVIIAQQALLRTEGLSRSVRTVITKAGKAISRANTRAAGLKAENQRLKQQLGDIRPQRKRKRVTLDLNRRFADIEQIISTVSKAAEEQARETSNPIQKQAIQAATAAVQASFDTMCTQWQL